MALNASTLSAAIRSQILARPAIQAINNSALTDLCDAIATAVVSHVTGAGVVVPTALVAPGGAGGPVTGVGSIT